jgi:hypothetical protein
MLHATSEHRAADSRLATPCGLGAWRILPQAARSAGSRACGVLPAGHPGAATKPPAVPETPPAPPAPAVPAPPYALCVMPHKLCGFIFIFAFCDPIFFTSSPDEDGGR